MKTQTTTSKFYLSLSIITLSLLFLSTVAFAAGQWKPSAALLSDTPAKQVMVQVERQSNSLTALNYSVPTVSFTPVTYQNVGGSFTKRCEMGNAKLFSEPGLPEVPFIYSRIIIPQGRGIESIRVIPGNIIELPGSHVLTYGEIPHPIGSKTVTWAKPDASIYESDAAFPGKTHELTSIQYRCGVAIAYVNIFPLTYYPKSGRVSYFKTFSLEVKYKLDPGAGTDVKVRPERLLKGKITEENPEALNSYTSAKDIAPTYTYVVIADQSFIDATTDPNLNDLIALRESQGFTTYVESMDNITNTANGVRDAVKTFYNDNNTEFVLLAGDAGSPELIPCHVELSSHPTDLPSQCLDGTTWNEDWEAEVFIGRISAGDADECSNQIYKILAYENSSTGESYLTSGLSLGEELDANTYGKEAMQELASFFSDDWTWQDLHDEDGDWNKSELIAIINSDEISIINHLGHSNTTYNMKMSNGNESQFTNTKYIFGKSQGCIPGKFTDDCIAERFTTENRNGFFAGVWNSNNGYYSPGDPTGGSSHQVHRAFWNACWTEDMNYFGEFNEYSHRTCTNYERDILESNLFGCPAMKFKGKEVAPFVRVFAPNGGEKWEQDRLFEVRWDDNVDDNVKVELVKGTSVQDVLASSTVSNGVFEWNVASDFPIATDYKIRITSTVTDTLIDESDDFFAVEEKSNLALVMPNGGEVFLKDQEYEITWGDNLSGMVRIDVTKNDNIYTKIIESTESDGSYNWTVPQQIKSGDDYKMRITSIDKPWLFDESDDNITIESPIVDVPYFQNFDNFLDSGAIPLSEYWDQLEDDSLHWTLWSGPTPSRIDDPPDETGPMGDNTSGNGKYLYTEASFGNSDKLMHMTTPVFNFQPVATAELSFYYHMFDQPGQEMGDLYMDIWDGATWTNDVVTISGDQGDQWLQKTVDMNSYAGKENVQIRFRGHTGGGWHSDICIDDFRIEATVGINDHTVKAPANFDLKYYNSRVHIMIPNSAKGNIKVDLYNVQGKLIKTLINNKLKAGIHPVKINNFDGKTLAAGLYLCKMKTESFTKTISVLIKK